MIPDIRSALNFRSPKTASQWIIFLAATAITLSSPYGTRQFNREVKRYIEQRYRYSKGKRPLPGSQNISQVLYKLRKKHIIRISKKGEKTTILLTERGKVKKLEQDLDRLIIPKRSEWDTQWRLVMFDIPESQKRLRETFRQKMKALGFHQFQKSVWIHPYPCKIEIDFVADLLGVNKYLTLLTVLIDNDEPLRKKFKL